MKFVAKREYSADPEHSELYRALSICCSEKALVILFLVDILSDHEFKEIANRLAIAQLLLDGKTQPQIVAELKVGAATVTKLRRWTLGNLATGGLAEVCHRLREENDKDIEDC